MSSLSLIILCLGCCVPWLVDHVTWLFSGFKVKKIYHMFFFNENMIHNYKMNNTRVVSVYVKDQMQLYETLVIIHELLSISYKVNIYTKKDNFTSY